MYPPVRRFLQRCLPTAVVRRLRRWRAPRVVARFTDADWPYAALVRAHVRAGDTVVDVGANMGYITARLAEYVGSTGRVYSFEPVPDTYEQLAETVRVRKLDQVTPIHACVSDQPGAVTMVVPEYESGGENLYESRVVDAANAGPGRRVAVQAVRLDDELPESASPLSFIKIDVEGHERAVIAGGLDVLRRHKPLLIIEVAEDPDEADSAAAALFATLAELEYTPYVLVDGRCRPRAKGDRSVDYVFSAAPL